MRIVATCLLMAMAVRGHSAEWYASPAGSSGNNGSAGSPWDLASAVADNTNPSSPNHSVAPGDTIWMRGGTYSIHVTSYLVGSSGSQITVRGYPGERPIVDWTNPSFNAFTVRGSYATFRDFEVTDASTNRINPRPTCMDVFGPATKLVNLTLHDAGSGIGIWSEAVNAEVSGCVIYNGGWFPDYATNGTGHGIYIQNDTGTKLIHDNIIVNMAGYGIHAYTEAGQLRNMRFWNNICANNGSLNPLNSNSRSDNILIGGYADMTNIVVQTNYTFHPTIGNSNVRFGLYSTSNGDLSCSGNYFVGGGLDWVKYWTNVVFTGNTIYSRSGDLMITTNSGASAYSWDLNTYYMGGMFIYQTNDLSFAAWKSATGYDPGSTSASPNSISGVWKFVHANPDATKAFVAIYNWGNADTVTVDASGVISPNSTYQARNAEDYFGPLASSGYYTGGTITLPMTNLTVAIPVGRETAPASTAPAFGVFVLEQLEQSTRVRVGAVKVGTLRGK